MKAKHYLLLLSAFALLTGVFYIYKSPSLLQGGLYFWGQGSTVKRDHPLGSMAYVPAGYYTLGDERPEARKDAPFVGVRLSAFYIDRYQVTNQEFEAFIKATNYVTTAEEVGGGWVYKAGASDWAFTKGANWRHPLGPGSSITHAMDHPVVLVSWYDATAYAAWVGKRLPTESEWEVAARSGTTPGTIPIKNPNEDNSANMWQGHWPDYNTLKNGYYYTAPVGAFPATQWGLYDMLGNAWEWTMDWYTDNIEERGLSEPNPTGPPIGEKRVARGGSWFCSPNYCAAYYPGFRGKSPPNYAFNNVGFRCAKDG